MKQNIRTSDMHYVGFWKRFDAFTIDLVIIITISFTLYSLFTLLFQGHRDNKAFGTLTWTILFLYNIYFVNKSGATPGKKFLKLKVVNRNFKKPTLKQVVLRELLGRSADNLTLFMGYVIIIFNKKKRALHDIIGGTYVVTQE